MYISDTQLELRRKASENGSSGMIIDSKDQEKQILTCCADCSAKYEAKVLSLPSDTDSTLSSLPSWLKDEKQRLNNSHHNQVNYLSLFKSVFLSFFLKNTNFWWFSFRAVYQSKSFARSGIQYATHLIKKPRLLKEV